MVRPVGGGRAAAAATAVSRLVPPKGSMRRGSALFAVSQGLGMAVGFLSSMLLVRVAPRESVASYLLLLQGITAVSLLVQLGLSQAVLRFAPLARGRGGLAATRRLERRLFTIQIAAWLVAAPVLVLAWPGLAWRLGAPELVDAAPWVIGAAVLISFSALADALLRVARFYAASALLSHLLVRGLVAACFAALYVAHGQVHSWRLLASVYVGAHLLAAVCFAFALPGTARGLESEPRDALPPPGIRTILGTTTAMALRGAVGVLMSSCDLWILSWARPHAEVAVYGVMLSLLQVMVLLPTIFSLVVPQEFAVLHAEGRRAELEWLARTSSTLVAMLSLATFAALAVLGRPVLAIAFGPEYVSGWPVLLILAAGRFCDSAFGSAGYLLQMTGYHVLLLRMTIAAAAANVLLALALARPFGSLGVALATTACLIGLNVAMVAFARRRVGVRTFVYLSPVQWKRVVGTALGAQAAAR